MSKESNKLGIEEVEEVPPEEEIILRKGKWAALYKIDTFHYLWGAVYNTYEKTAVRFSISLIKFEWKLHICIYFALNQ